MHTNWVSSGLASSDIFGGFDFAPIGFEMSCSTLSMAFSSDFLCSRRNEKISAPAPWQQTLLPTAQLSQPVPSDSLQLHGLFYYLLIERPLEERRRLLRAWRRDRRGRPSFYCQRARARPSCPHSQVIWVLCRGEWCDWWSWSGSGLLVTPHHR